jgi:hypothetical protein
MIKKITITEKKDILCWMQGLLRNSTQYQTILYDKIK